MITLVIVVIVISQNPEADGFWDGLILIVIGIDAFLDVLGEYSESYYMYCAFNLITSLAALICYFKAKSVWEHENSEEFE